MRDIEDRPFGVSTDLKVETWRLMRRRNDMMLRELKGDSTKVNA